MTVITLLVICFCLCGLAATVTTKIVKEYSEISWNWSQEQTAWKICFLMSLALAAASAAVAVFGKTQA